MRRVAMTGLWTLALFLAVTVAWQIVSAADDQVSERPLAPLNVAAPVNVDLQTTSTTTPLASTTTSVPETTSTSPGSSPGSSTGSSPGSTASTSPSTSTTQEASWQTRSVQTVGGTVLLRYRPGEVAYQSAVPAPGYQVEVEKQGPPEVKVEFESESQKVEIEASWGDGDLKVNVSEEDED